MEQSYRSYLLVAAHFIVLSVVAIVACKTGLLHLNFANILQWDSGWYLFVAREGYYYDPNAASNVAFFPLFPLMWRALLFSPLHLEPLGVAVVNFLLLLVSLFLLVRYHKLNSRETLLIASSFGLVYCWLPFSESLFLLTSMLLLIGYKKDIIWLTAIGLFLASLTRSAAVVFIPAVFIVELFKTTLPYESFAKRAGKVALYVGVCCLAVLLVIIIQWHECGQWFVFSKAHLHWGKKFQFPDLPLATWGNFKVLFIDASALITGLICGVILLYLMLVKLGQQNLPTQSDLLFSISYLGGVTLLSLLFGIQNNNTTFINSLNRYIFGTGFFMVLIIYQWRKETIPLAHILFALAFTIAGLALTGYFGNPYDTDQILSARWDAIGITIGVLVYLVPFPGKFNSLRFVSIYVFQTGLQLHFLDLYLNKLWIG